ncbi:MAG TPA: chemotaxis protein CheW [bacterium]|nr:chemotaxis protein CheW [bacterium]HPP88295.1 chemotaxis protein CheW [bacterium]
MDLLKKSYRDQEKNTDKEEVRNIQVVTFNIGKEEYAIDIMLVIEIIKTTQVTKVPLSLDFVKGVVNLRGNIVPIVDLKKKFKIVSKENPKDVRFIVVDIHKKTIGFQIDKVNEVIMIPENQIDSATAIVSGISQNYITGIAKLGNRLIILLNIEKLLSEEELEKITE